MQFSQINWIAWVIGGVAFMAIGFLWYGPILGKPWMAIMEKTGWKRSEMNANPAMYLVTFVCALAASYVLALVIRGLNIDSWWMGLVAGAIAWAGIGAAPLLTNSVFESRPKALWLIFSAYELIVFAGLGVLFALWK
jgi:hypothetical protein